MSTPNILDSEIKLAIWLKSISGVFSTNHIKHVIDDVYIDETINPGLTENEYNAENPKQDRVKASNNKYYGLVKSKKDQVFSGSRGENSTGLGLIQECVSALIKSNVIAKIKFAHNALERIKGNFKTSDSIKYQAVLQEYNGLELKAN
ncbi:hypothetical protein HK096_007534, partial [Nowakowskiella sp. JEL0078]